MPVVLRHAPPGNKHIPQYPRSEHNKHANAKDQGPMDTASWLRSFFLFPDCSLQLWLRAVMDHIPAVAASDNRRVCGCCRVADCASWHWGRPDFFILVCFRLSRLFLLSVGHSVVGAGTPDNIRVVCYLFLLSCHACTLPSLCRVHKKGCASGGVCSGVQTGQYPLMLQTVQSFSPFIPAGVKLCP
jgi:hypothetical protein